MSTQIDVIADGQFRLTKTDNKTGKVTDSVVEHADRALSGQQLGTILSHTIKSAGTRRAAFCSFLGMLYANPRLDGFKGTGDKETGKLSAEFKAAVRDVESDVVKALVADGSVKLPKTGNPEENMQAFLSGLRDDKNYSNAKNTTNKYFAICGMSCVTESGFVVPVPVMQAQLADAIERVAPDNTVSAKLRGIVEFMDAGTIDAVDCIDSLHLAKELVKSLERTAQYYAELATAQRGNKDIMGATQAALEAAKTPTPIGTRVRVPAPAQQAATA